VSCKTKSTLELAKTTPVTLPTINKNRNLINQALVPSQEKSLYINKANQLKILILVGILMTIVAEVKYARVSISIPIVNI